MKQIILSLLVVSCLFNCQNKPEESVPKTSEKIVYDMYEPSEMANLMNQMYAENLKVKNDILDGKLPTEFPMDFLKIHSAQMSDFKQRNEIFKSFSKLFIDAEKEIFNTASEMPIEDRFNNAVNLCISCHQTECTGPIPRIKKLLIK
jgi:cytochrome c553